MSKSVKLPDPVYKTAKKEAERRDISMGEVIDSWLFKAQVMDRLGDGDPNQHNRTATLDKAELEEIEEADV